MGRPGFGLLAQLWPPLGWPSSAPLNASNQAFPHDRKSDIQDGLFLKLLIMHGQNKAGPKQKGDHNYHHDSILQASFFEYEYRKDKDNRGIVQEDCSQGVKIDLKTPLIFIFGEAEQHTSTVVPTRSVLRGKLR
jgi:hypothetical protein